MAYQSGDFREFDPSTPAERLVMFLLEELSAISDKLDVIIEGQLPIVTVKSTVAKVEVPAVAPSPAPPVPKAADRFKRR